MSSVLEELSGVAGHLGNHRESLMFDWMRAVKCDPTLHQGDSLPQTELFDDIPRVLTLFEQALYEGKMPADPAKGPVVAHGLQRWQQGYDLREVTREWGQLNRCVIAELDRYAQAHDASAGAMSQARSIWTDLCSAAIEESVSQYFALQQREAAGHVEDLERALEHIRALEQQRGELWRQAAHDLRGNLGVVSHVAVGLTRPGQRDESRDNFVRILTRNVTSLHQLLNDVTSLARLQAGRERREIEPIDATTVLDPLCESIRPLAEQRGLYLRSQGPAGLAVDGDVVKVRRIAQNLILNAVKFTREGGITVTWGDSRAGDAKRWLLTIQDTGPGFHNDSGRQIAAALKPQEPSSPDPSAPPAAQSDALLSVPTLSTEVTRSLSPDSGEGIGLSIVKRLCELLDATIEMESTQGKGTTFRIFFPRQYAA